MGPKWGPPGPCRPQMNPILASWTLLSGSPPGRISPPPLGWSYQCKACEVAPDPGSRQTKVNKWGMDTKESITQRDFRYTCTICGIQNQNQNQKSLLFSLIIQGDHRWLQTIKSTSTQHKKTHAYKTFTIQIAELLHCSWLIENIGRSTCIPDLIVTQNGISICSTIPPALFMTNRNTERCICISGNYDTEWYTYLFHKTFCIVLD